MLLWKNELYRMCLKAGVTVEDVLGKSRSSNLVKIRIEFTKLCREDGWSYPQIAKALKRDHATIHNYMNPKKNKAQAIINQWNQIINKNEKSKFYFRIRKEYDVSS